jgi:hypothetical protein
MLKRMTSRIAFAAVLGSATSLAAAFLAILWRS